MVKVREAFWSWQFSLLIFAFFVIYLSEYVGSTHVDPAYQT
jgi:hypothetical protein